MINDELLIAAARAAAEWWTARLRDGAGIGDNGGRDPANTMARVLVRHARNGAEITEQTCEAFRAHLEQSLHDALSYRGSFQETYHQRRSVEQRGWDGGSASISLDIDYHATGVLYDACRAAGLSDYVADSCALPLKTRMAVSARVVEVAHGYGAKWKTIHGPVWGASVEEHDRAATYRDAQVKLSHARWSEEMDAKYGANRTYETLRAAGESFGASSYDWSGPVPE